MRHGQSCWAPLAGFSWAFARQARYCCCTATSSAALAPAEMGVELTREAPSQAGARSHAEPRFGTHSRVELLSGAR